jgi:hypothetical protein
MFTVLILVCSINLSPAECRVQNALDVIRGPDADTAASCGVVGQTYVAGAAVTFHHRSDEYLKFVCATSIIGRTVG